MPPEYFDVLIIGAGLSGIDAAHHLQQFCPKKRCVILEQRDRIGGTWDLFRYPGIRSDSDMLTMGYSFRPWMSPKAISPGDDIRGYIADTASEEGIDRHIRFGHRIQSAAWSSETATWTVDALRKSPDGEESVTLTCNFLFSCAGYYRYSAGYTPEFPGVDQFQGTIVHPQAWPENVDYTGRRVLIIGSGAKAVTLGARDGKNRGPCDNAAAFADLRHFCAGAGQDCKLAARQTARDVGLQAQPLEKRRVHDLRLPVIPALSGFRDRRDS